MPWSATSCGSVSTSCSISIACPAAAVVDDAVSMVRAAKKSSAAGFANAVLRRISRSRGALGLPPRPAVLDADEATLAYLSTTLSHPRWLVERWVARFGPDATERWLQFNNAPAPLTLRAHAPHEPQSRSRELLRDAGVETQPTRYAPDGLTIVAGQPRALLTRHQFVLQDETSQLVGLLATGTNCHPRTGCLRGSRRQDADHARSGSHRERCWLPRTCVLAESASFARPSGVRTRRTWRSFRWTCAIRCRLTPVFDMVLVDAPCSGLGILRRDPDIKWRRRVDDLDGLAATASAGCCVTPPRSSRPAAGWSTAPARASPKRMKPSWSRSSPARRFQSSAHPTSAVASRRSAFAGERPRLLPDLALAGRSRSFLRGGPAADPLRSRPGCTGCPLARNL